jgi:prevent-host-death family protein
MYVHRAVHGLKEDLMVVGVRELGKNASAIVDGVSANNERAVITKRGLPVAVMVPVDSTELEDYVLANAPGSVSAMVEADTELASGRTVSLDDVLAELG